MSGTGTAHFTPVCYHTRALYCRSSCLVLAQPFPYRTWCATTRELSSGEFVRSAWDSTPAAIRVSRYALVY
eukprot:866318-Rhodomonas_salina.1